MFFANVSPWVLLAFVVVVLVWIALMVAMATFIVRLFLRNSGGGWGQLLDRYEALDQPPDGFRCTRGRTVQVGQVVYKRCATLGTSARGLYLQVWRNRAVLIPWTEIHDVTTTRLHWRPAFAATIGEPLNARLTLYAEDFDALRPYLPFQRRDSDAPAATTAV